MLVLDRLSTAALASFRVAAMPIINEGGEDAMIESVALTPLMIDEF
jgi:hypothetical protein